MNLICIFQLFISNFVSFFFFWKTNFFIPILVGSMLHHSMRSLRILQNRIEFTTKKQQNFHSNSVGSGFPLSNIIHILFKPIPRTANCTYSCEPPPPSPSECVHKSNANDVKKWNKIASEISPRIASIAKPCFIMPSHNFLFQFQRNAISEWVYWTVTVRAEQMPNAHRQCASSRANNNMCTFILIDVCRFQPCWVIGPRWMSHKDVNHPC